MSTTQVRTLQPHSKESEMMILGCMLTSINSLNIASEEVTEDDFYFPEHKEIFRILKDASINDKPADVHLIAESLKKENRLQEVGGIAYLTTLAQYAGTSAYIEEYAKELKEMRMRRDIIRASQEVQKDSFELADPFKIIDKLKNRLENIEKNKEDSKSEISQIGEIIQGKKSQIDDRPFLEKVSERQSFFEAHGKPYLTGIPTGFVDLDSKATPLEDTNLIIVAARPAMGKTALGMNIASYTCFEKNMPVGVISLEMGRDQLLERLISSRTRIPGENIKRGILTKEELKKIKEEVDKISDSQFFIIDRGCHTIQKVVSTARKLKEAKGIKLLVLDYLQLLGSGGSSDSRQYEVAEISRSLKMLAMELKIPILCIAQLSRKVEERMDKRPLMSDLRDSGQIEQDADAILFIYRRDYYDKNDKPNEAELLLKKNRHGSEVDIRLHFNKECGTFSNLAPLDSLKNATHQDSNQNEEENAPYNRNSNLKKKK